MEYSNLANFIYSELLADIIELRLLPGGFVQERSISERFSVSRTPAREALKRLIQEGWLIAEDRKRPVVKGFSVEEARSLFQFRQMVEIFALGWAFENGAARRLAGQLDGSLQKMRNSNGDKADFIRSDVEFHTEIVNAVGNDFLSKSWNTISNEIIRLGMYGMDYLRTTDEILREHETLIQCMWENKKEEAVKGLAMHLRQVLDSIERQLIDLNQNGR